MDLQGLRHCPEFEPRSNKGPVGLKIHSLSLGKIHLECKIGGLYGYIECTIALSLAGDLEYCVADMEMDDVCTVARAGLS